VGLKVNILLSLFVLGVYGSIWPFFTHPPSTIFLGIWYGIEAYFLIVVLALALQIDREKRQAWAMERQQYGVSGVRKDSHGQHLIGAAVSG
jgi:hypothetical protein